MKFRKFGRICLALAVSLGTGLGVTSCSTDHAVGYFYATGSQYNQVSGFRIDNNLGQLMIVPNSPFGSGGVNPIKALTANAGKFLYVLNAGCGGTSQIACPTGTAASDTGANISLFTIGGKGSLSFQAAYTSQGNNPISIQDGFFRNPSLCPRFHRHRSHYLPLLCAWRFGDHLWRHHFLQHRPQYRQAFADHQPGSKKWEWHQPLVLSRRQRTDQFLRGSE